jgi:hypothetical protein
LIKLRQTGLREELYTGRPRDSVLDLIPEQKARSSEKPILKIWAAISMQNVIPWFCSF